MTCPRCLPLLSLLFCSFISKVSAEQFTFEFFTDNSCSTIKSGNGGGGSWSFQTDQCNAWTSSIDNSMKVLSCSSSCICFEQSPNSASCNTNGNVKEMCTSTCNEDDQGSWLQMRDFSGCGSLQVDDSEYSCQCTKMASNSVCTGSTSSGTTQKYYGVAIGSLMLFLRLFFD
eukprot:CAMPEP_0113626646 /NCGR_PEP_ID=MMETSP0017_2-20120614/13783_1 /TAXON_ID=2856 /ORGANISM="Cylindrotheca closterium" /LENGTH=171 /DNA_ID=CAMNT_0000536839 /DNA_START=66 /DNA_END=581 /DNA_ORIENTATION=+ /assembly_acc=CAM_ASM_000147